MRCTKTGKDFEVSDIGRADEKIKGLKAARKEKRRKTQLQKKEAEEEWLHHKN